MILVEDLASGNVLRRETSWSVAGRSVQAGDAVEQDVAIPFHEVRRQLIGQSKRLRPAPLPLVSSGQPAEKKKCGKQSPHASLRVPSWLRATLTQPLQHLFTPHARSRRMSVRHR